MRVAGLEQRALLALLGRFGRRTFRLRGSRFATGDRRDMSVGELQIEPGTRGNRAGAPLRLAIAIAHKDETAGKNLLIAEPGDFDLWIAPSAAMGTPVRFSLCGAAAPVSS